MDVIFTIENENEELIRDCYNCDYGWEKKNAPTKCFGCNQRHVHLPKLNCKDFKYKSGDNKDSKMKLKDFVIINRKKINIETIIFYPEVRDLCKRPYPNHKEGCPNQEKCRNAPYFNEILSQGNYAHFYLIWATFDFLEYKRLRREIHPEWSEAQLGNSRHWQNSVKSILRNEVNEIYSINKAFYVLGSGGIISFPFQKKVYSMEATGINVFSTLKKNAISFELKPKTKILLCFLICSVKKIQFQKNTILKYIKN